MEIKKKCVFRSDLTQEYIKKHYKKTGELLHFSSQEHDEKYMDVWESVNDSEKHNLMLMFVKSKEEAIKKYLEDSNMNNIPIRKFDCSSPSPFMRFRKKGQGYALYLNACYYKGLLRHIIGVINSQKKGIKLYCVQKNPFATGYFYASDNIKDVSKYMNNDDYGVWIEK